MPDGVDQFLQLIERQPGRHGADDMLAGLQRLARHPHVQWGGSKDTHGIHVGRLQHFAEVIKNGIAAISLLQRGQTVWTDVADSGDSAVGIEMPLELRAETSAYNPDADRRRRGHHVSELAASRKVVHCPRNFSKVARVRSARSK